MINIKFSNILTFLFLGIISLIYCSSNLKYEIPITYSSPMNLPIIEILFNKEDIIKQLTIDIGQEKSWLYINSNKTLDNNNSLTVKYDTFSITGEKEKTQCFLSDKEKNKILQVENFEFLSVNNIKGDEPFLNTISLNNIIYNIEIFKNEINDKNYGFKIDFPSQKLIIGKLFIDDKEKENLNKFELVKKEGNKWEINLTAIFFDDINLNKKKDNIYKIVNRTSGIFINKSIFLETVYTSFYVPKEFFDYLGNYDYFIDNNENICDRKIEKGMILYYCNKKYKDKIKNINLVLNNKYVLSITKEKLIKCPDNSNLCEFNIKFNPKIKNFILGIDILKNLNIYFMKNEHSIYLDNNIEICDLSEGKFKILGKKEFEKALFELLKTFSVILSIFAFLFIFFFIHSKFRGHLYIDNEKDDKNEEMIDIDEKDNKP